jgi:hypothetical protein
MEIEKRNMPQPLGIDTSETYAYKLAHYWRIPLDYILIHNMVSNSPSYTNILELVGECMKKNISYGSISAYLSQKAGRDWDTIVIKASVLSFFKENIGEKNIRDIGEYSILGKKIKLFISGIIEFKRSYGMKTMSDLNLKHTGYKESMDKEMAEIDNKIIQLRSVQSKYRECLSAKDIKISEMKVSLEVINSTILNDYVIEDILSIFDSSIVSENVPHIVCHLKDKTYQKVYNPDPFSKKITKKDTVDLREYFEPYTIIFTIRLSQVHTAVYNVESKRLILKIRPSDKEAYYKIMEKHFPSLSIKTTTVWTQTRITLYPIKSREIKLMLHYLLHLSITNPELYQFYLSESTSPFPYKNVLNLRYRPNFITPISALSKLGGLRKKEEGSFSLEIRKTIAGDSCIDIITETVGIDSVYRLYTSIIPTMCIYYAKHIKSKSPLSELYNIPNLEEKKETKNPNIKKELSDMWPDVFAKANADKTRKPNDMVRTTTDKSEAEEWEKEYIQDPEKEIKRMVLPFPKEGPILFYFTSYDPSKPYVGYIQNIYEDNPIYNMIPASISTLAKSDNVKVKCKSPTLSFRALEDKCYAISENIVNTIIGFDTKRMGSKICPDSILYVLASVMPEISSITEETSLSSDNESIEEHSDDKKTLLADSVRILRTKMLNLSPEIYKQSLYDLTNEQIIKRIKKKDSYIDPLLYHSALEEISDLNIYIIRPTIKDNVSTYAIEIPRHTQMYCKNYESRKCIIIFLNSGTKSDILLHPHCEFIIPKDTKNPKEAVFSKEVSDRMTSIMMNCNKTYAYKNPSGFIYKSISMLSKSKIVIKRLLNNGYSIISQYVDAYGKGRAVTFKDEDNEKRTIFFHPFPPLNLKHSNKIFHASEMWIKKISDNEDILGYSNIGVFAEDKETKEIIYCRTNKKYDIEYVIDLDPLFSAETFVKDSFLQKSADKDRLSRILAGIFKHCMFSYNVLKSFIGSDEFIKNYLTYTDSYLEDEILYYNINNVEEKLPTFNSEKEIIQYLSSIIPVKSNKAVLHNKEYFMSVSQILFRYSKIILQSSFQDKHIKDYYLSVRDFTNRKDTIIRDNRLDPITNIIDQQWKFMIRESLIEHDIDSKMPLFYEQDKILYIVQSTINGSVMSAYFLCKMWKSSMLNYGPVVENPPEDLDEPIIVYKIRAGRLNAHSFKNMNKGIKYLSYFEIVNYKESKYAALMRIK